jgi:hypothetical protein
MHFRAFLSSLALGSALVCVATLASGQQIYKWKDARGVVHFSQTPPTSGTHYTQLHLHGVPRVAHNPPARSAPAPSQPRGNPANNPPAQASTAPGTQPDTPGNRVKVCKRLTANIALLQGKQPIVTQGNHGKQMVMSDEAREQQLATARAQRTQYCSSKGS